jgi:thiamine biosynthesis lipoprotein
MACRFEVTLPRSEDNGIVAATGALDEVDRLEAQLTVFRDSSEVSYVNAHAADAPVNISQALFDLFDLCLRLNKETEGAFDITSGPLTRCWGFLKREGHLPSNAAIDAARTVVGSDKLHLDERAKTIRFLKRGMEINLGSIGKGFALDCAGALLSKHNLRTALLNAGASSMRAIGDGEHGEGWVVGLRHPSSKFRRLGVVRLRNCSLSTSGSEEQYFDHAGRRFSHIIDPRTGWPAESVTSVTVVAPTGSLSDALATAFFVGGREFTERYCSGKNDVMAIMLERDSKEPVVIGNSSGCDGLRDF